MSIRHFDTYRHRSRYCTNTQREVVGAGHAQQPGRTMFRVITGKETVCRNLRVIVIVDVIVTVESLSVTVTMGGLVTVNSAGMALTKVKVLADVSAKYTDVRNSSVAVAGGAVN